MTIHYAYTHLFDIIVLLTIAFSYCLYKLKNKIDTNTFMIDTLETKVKEIRKIIEKTNLKE